MELWNINNYFLKILLWLIREYSISNHYIWYFEKWNQESFSLRKFNFSLNLNILVFNFFTFNEQQYTRYQELELRISESNVIVVTKINSYLLIIINNLNLYYSV